MRTDKQRDRWTNITKLMVVLRNCVNALKIYKLLITINTFKNNYRV